jgi:glycosyltransferase involved in cell wall biosynthesis
MYLSILIPLYNEANSLPELNDWIHRSIKPITTDYEVIFIDDGSRDRSWQVLQEICKQNEKVQALQFIKNYGKSQALHAGFEKAQGEYVATMDADLQDSPAEIPLLIDQLEKEDLDLISGWKRKRYDSYFMKNLPSKLFNWVAWRTSGVKIHDFNCGLKVYKNEVVKAINVQGEMHRYLPVLAKNEGFDKIGEKPVKHSPRKYGKTKFGAERFLYGFLDLLTIWFFSRFGKRPMHFFGAFGLLMFIIGFLLTFWLGASKLYKVYKNITEIRVTDNPWFYIALTAMIIGVILFVAGFLGELMLKTKTNEQNYIIRKERSSKTDTLSYDQT